ncbi:MAG: 50S ribosomal protein L32e [Thermoplasmatales archaeon]|nr:50S ribosomal protein L32e [Thermoplasmatales archaeon]
MEKRKSKPRFIRQQLWQVKRLDDVWRRPRGIHSKQREHYHYRSPLPKIGYSSPKKVKGLHPSGFKEKLVYNLKDLEGIDAEKEAIKIAHSVGKKKRQEIIAKADELGIRVLNRVLR